MICVSIALLIYNLGGVGVEAIMFGNIPGAFVTLACGFGIPACGYFGARQKNKELLCAFWVCTNQKFAFAPAGGAARVLR
eukprot:SAG11_NODE_1714_length_4398_cov_2.677832_1_plen_80_part_00